MKRLFALLEIVLMTGCSAQLFADIPPANWSVIWTWTAPAPVSGETYTYVLSVDILPAGTTTCPADNGTNYATVNLSAPVSAATYDYLKAPVGQVMCAVVQTLANGDATNPSLPSGVSNAVAIPTAPPTPGAPSGAQQAAMMVTPALPNGTKGSQLDAMNLRGTLVWKK